MKDISISEFVAAKRELRDNIRDAIVMFVEDFYNKTGFYPNGDISFEQQYCEFETSDETQHIGMTVSISLGTELEYDD